MRFSLQNLAKKFKKNTLVPAAFAGFIVGTPADDVLSDAGKLQDYVYAKAGNDVLVYTPSINQKVKDHYDGGAGIDTLWLRVSEEEFNHQTLRADLIALQWHIYNHANVTSPSKGGRIFEFESFDLSVRNIENLMIEPINTRSHKIKMVIPQELKKIKDTFDDSLA